MQHLTTPRFCILGVAVHAVQIPQVVAQMQTWVTQRSGTHFIAVTGMHGVVEAQHDDSFKQILNSADLVVPDGMPLVYLGREQGYALPDRVCGPELLHGFCAATNSRCRHFFYGGMPGVAEEAANVLQQRYGIKVAGFYSPPFRPLTQEEEDLLIALLHGANVDVLWVALGTPKQERWMHEHRETVRVPVIVGVGAAVDFTAGRLRRAPLWMRKHGLEWFFRLLQEPRRLWRRYLVYGLEFVWSLCLERLGLKDFSPTGSR
jgi:N-acetylglucosaminyldiphosphoundecaprenol N-acetyl-beta-D-mannosaminyltransferase